MFLTTEIRFKLNCFFYIRNFLSTVLIISLLSLFPMHPLKAELIPIWQDSGKISVSVNAEGNNNPEGGTIKISKPEGATVRKAFIMAASHSNRKIIDGDIVLENTPISWVKSVFNGISSSNTNFFNNTLADVTSLVKTKLDNAPAGINNFLVKEVDTLTIDGVILTVIFDDPNQVEDKGVILLFGKQSPDGDSFIINLSNELDSNTGFANAGLGISYGFQTSSSTDQFSLVDVNGFRLSSSAGGQDDGISQNGGLITVGGIGDSNVNPPATSPPTGSRTDDEFYNLMPFIQSGDKSILFSTINPSKDDNILFAYFVTSVPTAILPPLAPPGKRNIYTSDLAGQIDSTKPTIVLTHGLLPANENREDLWTSFNSNRAGTLIQEQLGTNVNILQYTWEEAFTVKRAPDGSEYIAARENVPDAAANLVKRLFEELGHEYNQPIHFIGHSLGTAVNAYAARDVLNLMPNITKAQITIIDHPNLIENIPGISPAEADVWGFDDNFFASVLPINRQGLDLMVDNYFVESDVCLTCTGVGTRINGPVYNHLELVNPNDLDDKIFDDEGISNDHSGAQQWYRWTINPNGLHSGVCDSQTGELVSLPWNLHDSLNPCKNGWYWAINGPKSEEFPENNGQSLSTKRLQSLVLKNFTDYGCGIDGENTVKCQEQSSPFGIADIVIPESTSYLTFNYLFESAGDGDYAAVFIDDKPVWILSGTNAIVGVKTKAGPIPIRGLAGHRKITLALYGVGEKNAEIELGEFEVFDVEIIQNHSPIANAGTDQKIILGDLVTLDGDSSSDPEGNALTYSWTQTGGPTAILENDTSPNPTFTASEVGTYNFTLSVSDGELTSSDEIKVIVIYDFIGFYSPIMNIPDWNIAKAGRVIPVKFSLNGNQGMNIFENSIPVSKEVACEDMAGVGLTEKTATAGNSGLNYDADNGIYNYIWKTERDWVNTCRVLQIKLTDGTSHKALFKFSK